RTHVGIGRGDELVAHLHAQRHDAVAALAVDVIEQRDARRAVRVVFDGRHARRDVLLVAAEVDDAVLALVAAAAVAHGDAPAVVATALLALLLGQGAHRLVGGDLREVGDRLVALRRRDGPESLERHRYLLHFLEEGDGLTRLERDDGALPVRAWPGVAAQALGLARNGHRAHLAHLDLEQG